MTLCEHLHAKEATEESTIACRFFRLGVRAVERSKRRIGRTGSLTFTECRENLTEFCPKFENLIAGVEF